MEHIPLEYGSVCSGIEAVSLTWKPLERQRAAPWPPACISIAP